MSQLTQGDLQFAVSRIPRDVRDLMVKHPLYVGGGFVRETIAGGSVKDVDLFGASVEMLETVAGYITVLREARLHRSPNALTVLKPPRIPLQFITRWTFSTPEELVSSFDFTVCQAVVWFQNSRWHSAIHPSFYADLAARRLVYTAPVREEAAGGSMLRVRKFLQRGYNIQAQSLAGVIARLALASNKTGAATEGEIANAITGLLHEVDPILVVDGLDMIDEHEVISQ